MGKILDRSNIFALGDTGVHEAPDSAAIAHRLSDTIDRRDFRSIQHSMAHHRSISSSAYGPRDRFLREREDYIRGAGNATELMEAARELHRTLNRAREAYQRLMVSTHGERKLATNDTCGIQYRRVLGCYESLVCAISQAFDPAQGHAAGEVCSEPARVGSAQAAAG